MWTFIVLCTGAAASKQAVSYEPGPALKLTQYRLQHRRTLDGRLCAAAFSTATQTFSDCTTTRAPNGETGREWCYVEVQLLGQGAKDWDFCRPVIDYDYVRAVASDSLRAKVADADRMISKLAAEKAKLDDVLLRYDKTCVKDLNVTRNRLLSIDQLLQHAEHAMENAEEARRAIAALEVSFDTYNENFKRQMKLAFERPENCRLLRGYEDDGDADGLMGTYYPTPRFVCSGQKKQMRLDPILDFTWHSKEPAPGIPHEAFSVRWEGYLKAPESGEYRIMTETACGARVYLNKKLILTDRMPEEDYVEYGASDTDDHPVSLNPPGTHSGVRRVTSNALYLAAATKVPIRVEMVHATHLLWKDEELALFRLLWSGPHAQEEVVPMTSLFSSNQQPVLKLSRLPADKMEIMYLYPGTQPYLDRQDLWVADVPQELEGSKVIAMYSDVQQRGGDLMFEINVPATLYVTHEARLGNPLENKGDRQVAFKALDDQITLLKAPSNNVRAHGASYHAIEAATLSSPATYTFEMLKSDTPWMVFVQALPKSSDSCSGEVETLSDPTNVAFSKCLASSTYSDEYTCEAGLNRRHRDAPHATWKSASGQGPGQYLEVQFSEKVQLSQFRFKALDDPLTWPSEVQLRFETGAVSNIAPQKFTLLYSTNLEILTYDIAPVKTDYVKLEITQMYANSQSTGGSIEFLGTRCVSDQAAANPSFLKSQLVPSFSIVSCAATVSQIDDFPAVHDGLIVDLACPSDCRNSVNVTQAQPVYGSSVYAPDSALCLAAVHAGVCGADTETSTSSGDCLLTMRILPGQSTYQASTRNKIHSQQHGPHDYSLIFEPRVNEKPLETLQTTDNPDDATSYTVVMHTVSSLMPALPAGVALDEGAVFASREEFKYPDFGWTRKAKVVQCADLQRSNGTASSLLSVNNQDAIAAWMNTGGVSFPPASSSAACKAGTEDCTPNAWSIKLPVGAKVDVMVQLGHPCQPAAGKKYRYDLSVNGDTMADNIQLAKGDFYFGTKTNVRIPESGKLTLTSGCSSQDQTSCTSALTTVMGVALKVRT